jgi:hypothetical protein
MSPQIQQRSRDQSEKIHYKIKDIRLSARNKYLVDFVSGGV